MNSPGLTVGDVKRRYGHRYAAPIRNQARQRCDTSACARCDYSAHVEAAHLRPIASFPDDALVAEVNDPTNILGLCPNHHWEFDSGLPGMVSFVAQMPRQRPTVDVGSSP